MKRAVILCAAVLVAWFAVLATPWARSADIDVIYPVLAEKLPLIAAIITLGISLLVLWISAMICACHGRKFLSACILFPLLVVFVGSSFISVIYMFLSWMLFLRDMPFYRELAVSMSICVSIILFMRVNRERVDHISKELEKVTPGQML